MYPLHGAVEYTGKYGFGFESIWKKKKHFHNAIIATGMQVYLLFIVYLLDFSEEVLKLLINNGANLEALDSAGRTPL